MAAKTRRNARKLLLVTALSAALGAPLPALAQQAGAGQADAQAMARVHYQKGKDLYDQGSFPEALKEFQIAYDTKPHPVVLKSIAECKVQLGDLLGAIATLEQFVADPAATGKEAVQARLNEIKAMLATIEVTSEPAAAAITVNSLPTGQTTPATFNLAPGAYEIVLTVDGYEPLTKKVQLVSGTPTNVAVNFAAEGTAVKPAGGALIDPFEGEGETQDTALAEEETEKDKGDGPPPAFWACAAIAGVGLITGTVFGTMALSDEEDYKKNDGENATKSKKDAGERNALIADVSFGLAAAAAVVGIVILATDHKKEEKAEEKTAKLHVLPMAGEQSVGLNTVVEF